jgi:hypothetical protein
MALDAHTDSIHIADRWGSDSWRLDHSPGFPHLAAKTAPRGVMVSGAVRIVSDKIRYIIQPTGILWLPTGNTVEGLSTGETTCEGGKLPQYAGLWTMMKDIWGNLLLTSCNPPRVAVAQSGEIKEKAHVSKMPYFTMLVGTHPVTCTWSK